MARDKGLCRKCKGVGTEIDHINGSAGDLHNLQLLCALCHFEKTFINIIPLRPDHEKYNEKVAKLAQLIIRIKAEKPQRLCDNDVEWENQQQQISNGRWAEILKARKAAFFKT